MENYQTNTGLVLRLVAILFVTAAFVPTQVMASPVVMYTDILSGPNTGGEDNNGIYLSIFGTGFGIQQGSSKVYINGTEVAAYKYWGDSQHGRPNIQQITVQPGPAITSGSIKVTVDGMDSNIDHTFTVRKGDIYFVSLDGRQDSGEKNNIFKPFRGVESTYELADFEAGDTIVMRGGVWAEKGSYDVFCTFKNKSGTPGNPISVMGYPGENITIKLVEGGTKGFTNYDGTVGHILLSNFEIDMNGSHDAAIADLKYDSRAVNISVHGMKGTGGGTGAIGGWSDHSKILGCTIYDIGSMKLYHAIYVNAGGTGNREMEIAYNHIYNVIGDGESGGNAIQVYTGGDWEYDFEDFKIHNNLIHGIDKSGIAIDDDCSGDWEIYNNVIYNVNNGGHDSAGISLNGLNLSAKVYHNTIYDFAEAGLIVGTHNGTEIKNNIIRSISKPYLSGSTPNGVLIENNLWYGNGQPPEVDINPVYDDPLFEDPGNGNFRLKINSPGIGKGITQTYTIRDFEGVSRPSRNLENGDDGFDIGAYEFDYNAGIAPPKNLRIVALQN